MSGGKRRWHWLVPVVVFATLTAVTLLRYQGLVLPVRIASGSMAEQFLGPHRLVACAECGFTFRCGLDTQAPLQRATCPNCGFPNNNLSLATLHDGDRVVIDRWAYLRRLPQRGDVVAFVDPTNDSELAVKRVLGLPQETVTIRRGELFVNGSLYRKSLEEAKELATLVYDDTFRLSAEQRLPSRWQSEDPTSSGWRVARDGYRWTRNAEATAEDWLMYRHWRCYGSPHPRTQESPVTDNDAYNQGLSRELHEVTDLLLSCDVSLTEDGEIMLLIHDGRESFKALLSARTRSIRLYRGDEVLERAATPVHADATSTTIEFGVIDNQLLIGIAGETVVRHAYTPRQGPLQPTSRPVGIAGSQDECSVANLRIYRDIYYLNPFRGDWAWAGPDPLADETFLVLGDNAPLSNDSRHWAQAGLHRQRLLGKVLTPRG
ncbi:MAG: signal peptidase I [Pirellulaceae bacterium]